MFDPDPTPSTDQNERPDAAADLPASSELTPRAEMAAQTEGASPASRERLSSRVRQWASRWMGRERRLLKSNIQPHEQVVFFPTYAYRDGHGAWRLQIHGWIYRPAADARLQAMSVRLVCRLLGFNREQVSSPTFQERIRPFLVHNEKGKRLTIRLGDKTFPVDRSVATGHFRGVLQLTHDELRELLGTEPIAGQQVTFAAATAEGDLRTFPGSVELLAPQGLSVVSDIDDTIKESHVSSKRLLLQRTFLEPFEPVHGMSDLYREWHAQGAAFHYVSVSPWQLYTPLASFLTDSPFPPGSFHLQAMRFRNTGLLRLFASPRIVKRRAIRPILQQFPQRKFIFVGDSGQRDPEIYGYLARKFPQQVVGIYIRNVTGDSGKGKRWLKAFRGIPTDRWQLFDHPDELRGLSLPIVGEPRTE